MDRRSLEELIDFARQVRNNAYAPYSDFAVGAVVESRDGRIFTGCNVENASYGLTLCAERVALGNAISEGARDLVRVVVTADTATPIPPCGACRQLILELAGPDAEVVMTNLAGDRIIASSQSLLPFAFDRQYL